MRGDYEPTKIRYGSVYQRRNGKWCAELQILKRYPFTLGELDNRNEAELLLAVAKAEFLKQMLTQSLGKQGAINLIKSIDILKSR